MDNTSYSMYSGLEYEEAALVEDIIKNLSDEELQNHHTKLQSPKNVGSGSYDEFKPYSKIKSPHFKN